MTESTVLASAGSGGLISYDYTYATARAGDADTASANADYLPVGQSQLSGGRYNCWELLYAFDTSAIGTDDISAAVLSLYADADSSTVDFTIEARIHDWDGTLETTDWVAGADLSGDTLVASYDTSSGWAAGYIAFTDVALAANINKTGVTYIVVSSSRHRDGTAPVYANGTESVSVRWAATKYPKLVITHAAAAPAAGRSQAVVIA